MSGRTRIHVPSRRGDSEYFQRVTSEISSAEGVESVEANPVTGSVLIHHGDDVTPIMRTASERALFELILPEEAPPGPPLTSELADRLLETDRRLREATQGRINLTTAVMLALTGAGIFQVLRGAVLPAGATLLWYAFRLAWVGSVKNE